MQHGIDISSWNTVSDWGAVHGDGIEFASVKLSQGNYYTNPLRSAQVAGSRSAGIATGGYHFADPRNGVSANVSYFVAELRALGLLGNGSFLPMLDVEDSPTEGITWDAGSANAFVAEFIREFRAQTGVASISIYANLSTWQNILRPNDWADSNVAVWLALYNGDPGNTQGWSHQQLAIHQHTSAGTVPGIPKAVDKNVTVNGFTIASLCLGGTPALPTPPGPPAPPSGDTYVVQAGDTLSGIAAKYGTTWQALAQLNHLPDPNLIRVGQVLRVRGSAPTGGSTYTVVAGDTLSGIGAKLGVSWPAIASANGIGAPYTIYPGQVLQIPGGGGAPAPGPQTYTVVAGDTLSGIGVKVGVNWQDIAAKNGITSPYIIRPGQVLTL